MDINVKNICQCFVINLVKLNESLTISCVSIALQDYRDTILNEIRRSSAGSRRETSKNVQPGESLRIEMVFLKQFELIPIIFKP